MQVVNATKEHLGVPNLNIAKIETCIKFSTTKGFGMNHQAIGAG